MRLFKKGNNEKRGLPGDLGMEASVHGKVTVWAYPVLLSQGWPWVWPLQQGPRYTGGIQVSPHRSEKDGGVPKLASVSPAIQDLGG